MGGNALSVESCRLEKSEYEIVSKKIKNNISRLYLDNKIEIIPAYKTKPNFGDLDILIESTGFNPFDVSKLLSATEVVRNGPVTSIGIELDGGRIFQTDLITINRDSFDYALNYFSYNDQGNLVGRVAHAMGLSHRHDGMFYYYREGDHKVAEIELTKDYEKGLAALGFDQSRCSRGFDRLEDIFSFVVKSQFFNKEIYLLENRNAISRIRDRKRPTYNAFLKWIEDKPSLTAYSYPKEKAFFFQRIDSFFPHFLHELNEAKAKYQKTMKSKESFNGRLVGEITGLEGKSLGILMSQLTKQFGNRSELENYVMQAGETELKNWVLKTANSELTRKSTTQSPSL